MENGFRDLLTGIADGGMDALGELYDNLSVRVLNYAIAITRNRETAEDVTHDVFLQINKQAARIAKMSSPVAYIMVMTRNHAYNALKRGKRLAELPDEITEAETNIFDRLLLEDAFSSLPAVQRETVYLHLVCGFTHKETAGIQNAPVVTVKWRYGKALERLKAFLTNGEEGKCNESV